MSQQFVSVKCQDILDVRAVVTDLLLHHLKPTGTELHRLHLLTTVTLPCPGRWLCYWLVPYHLHRTQQPITQVRKPTFHHTMWINIQSTDRVEFHSYHFNTYWWSSTTHRHKVQYVSHTIQPEICTPRCWNLEESTQTQTQTQLYCDILEAQQLNC